VWGCVKRNVRLQHYMKGWFAAMKLKGRIRMNQEFNSARNVYLDRDEQGVVRQLCCTLMLRLPSKREPPNSLPLITCINSANCWV